MKITVFRATGSTGRPLVGQALERCHEVRALARPPASFDLSYESLEVLEGDVVELASVEEAVEGRDGIERPGWGVVLWLRCDDAQELYDSLREAGVGIAQEPFESPFGRTFSFLDPDSYVVTVHDGG